jgi:hypothetical protein
LYLMYLMAEVPAMGPKPAENIVPLGIKRMMCKAQESRRDDGHQWTTVTTDLVVSSFSWTTVTAVF